MNDDYRTQGQTSQVGAAPRGRVPQVGDRVPQPIAKCATDAPRPSTMLEELTAQSGHIAERIGKATRRLREINERMFGMQPEEQGSAGAPVVGVLSALGSQFEMQRGFLAELEEQLGIAERI